MDPIDFSITAKHDADSADPHLTELNGGNLGAGNVNTGVIYAKIENLPGTLLPSTGGIGTTIFYLIGGILVLAAVVMLVTKKRMASAE